MLIENLEKSTLGCMKCGNCKAVCPIFKEIGEEAASPRGRVRLIKGVTQDEVNLSPRYQELIGKCLNCRACADECPSGIEPNKAVLEARAHIAIEKGVPFIKRTIFRKALRSRRLFPASAKLLGLLQRASLIGNSRNPIRLMFPLAGMPSDKAIPYFQLKTLLDQVPEINPVSERKYRVAYFSGCAGNLLFPEIGKSVVKLMNRFGVEVVVPKNQMCCGTPVFNSGDYEGGAYLAQRNLDVFANLDVDAIITACGSCGLSLKKEWRELMGVEVPETFANKVYDFAEFLVDCMGVTELGGVSGKHSITYHDPCHLARGMKVRFQPRKLLASTADLVEMKDADKCCGGGGAFSVYHPDLSRKVGDRKAENIMRTEAPAIATGCPSCLMQLNEMLAKSGSTQKASHTASILWDSLSS